jgi:hypothetical protein
MPKPSHDEISRSVTRMSVLVPFFPQGDIAVAEIMSHVEAMCGSREALDYLTNTAINTLERWGGVQCLRQILTQSTEFRCADGLAVDSRTREEKLAAAEHAHQERESIETSKRIAEWKRQRALMPPEERREADKLLDDVARAALKRLN